MSEYIRQFSPQRSRPEDLEKILVKREPLLAAAVEKLRASVLSPAKHHMLFVGPRGAGKTHLVSLIQHRLDREELADKVRFAWLNEDETSSSFLKLLLRIYRALASRYPSEFTLNIAKQVLGRSADEALGVLSKAFLEHMAERTCVVLIENLDELFDSMKESELLKWRAFLQNHAVIATVGTAQRLFDGVSDQKHVFYGFFDIQHLRPLSPEDARDLLKKLAALDPDDLERKQLIEYLESPKGKARLRAIHHLTGGNPRLYLILDEFLTRDTLNTLVPAFERMVDQQLTPYYQERLRWLSSQQREIVEFLCQSNHSVVPVKQIAAALFAEHSSIAGQLKKLKEMGYVVGNPRGREVLYELAEPLMRLSFQAKEAAQNGVDGPAPLRLLVDMLRVWFERKQLEESANSKILGATTRKYFEAALAENREDENAFRVEILKNSIAGIEIESCSEADIPKFEALAEESGAIGDTVTLCLVYWKHGKHEKIVTALAGEQNDSSPWRAVTPVILAESLYALDRRQEAVKQYGEALDAPDLSDELKISCLMGLGRCYSSLGDGEKAVEFIDRVFEFKDLPNELTYYALLDRAEIFEQMDNPEKAYRDYDRCLKLEGITTAQRESSLLGMIINAEHLGRWSEVLDRTAQLKKSVSEKDPQVPLISIFRIIAHRNLEEWSEVFSDFLELSSIKRTNQLKFVSDNDEGVRDLAEIFVESLFVLSPADAEIPRLRSTLKGLARVGFMPHLGSALVEYLGLLAKEKIDESRVLSWLDLWTKLGQGFDSLSVPLRMFKTGVNYLVSSNEGELLILPQEERRVVQQALGLEKAK